MRFLVVCRRELRAYFFSFVGYALIAVFLLLSGYYFYTDLVYFILFGGFVLPTGLWQYFFLDMRHATLLVLPLVTMRLFSEEKKLGTMELLWTYPVRDGEIVAGKFLAALAFFLVMLAGTAVCPLALRQFHAFEIGPLIAAYTGLFLLGTAFIACGLFLSSLTEDQVVSAFLTYGLVVLLWIVTWNEEAVNESVFRFLLGVSLFDHFYNFTRGVIDTQDLAFFVLFVAFFLFLTLQSLAVRKWRGVR